MGDPNGYMEGAQGNLETIIRDNPGGLMPPEGIAVANTRAILALVYEQRTANLIAYERLALEVNQAHGTVPDPANYLPATLRERLGQ